MHFRQQLSVARDRDFAGRARLAAVLRVDRRHIHNTATPTARQSHSLHRHGIDAAHRPVQDDAAEELDARDHLRHQVGPGSGLRSVFLEHQSPHAVNAGDLGRFDSIE
jgi:hypothetical protein